MRIVVSKRAVCAVGEDRRLWTVPVLLESFRIFCSCMHRRYERGLDVILVTNSGPPFSLSVLLVPLRLFARVLPLLLPLMLQLRLLLRRNPAPPINIYADLLSSISRCASEKRPDSSIHRYFIAE